MKRVILLGQCLCTSHCLLCLLFILCSINGFAQVDLQFSHENTFYSDSISLEINASIPEIKVHYTIDGSLPTTASPSNFPLILRPENVLPPRLSQISSSETWETPKNVQTAVVVKAQAFWNGEAVSELKIKHYLFTEKKDPLPVLFLSVQEEDFFDEEKGIYVIGKNEDDPNYFNRGQDSERPIHFQFFDNSGVFQYEANAGVRIHGNGSRRCAQKSLRLYAREEYGSKQFTFPFFSEKPEQSLFKRLVLRTPCADWLRTGFRDILAQQIGQNLELDIQASQAVQVYLNGEYWGVHNLRERADQHFLANHYHIESEEIAILENNGQSDYQFDDSWNELQEFLAEHDPEDAHFYEAINKRINIQNFIHYHCLEFFCMNMDWPFTNIKYWKAQANNSSESPKVNKWHWLPFDFDACFIRFQENPFPFFIANKSSSQYPEWATESLRILLQNPQFRKEFINTFSELLATDFYPSHTISLLEELRSEYLQVMGPQIDRWGSPTDLDGWLHSIEDIRRFLLERPSYLANFLEKELGSALILYPNPAKNQITIQSFEEASNFEKLSISNSGGQVIYEENFGALPLELNILEWPKGMYFLRVETAAQVQFQRFCKE